MRLSFDLVVTINAFFIGLLTIVLQIALSRSAGLAFKCYLMSTRLLLLVRGRSQRLSSGWIVLFIVITLFFKLRNNCSVAFLAVNMSVTIIIIVVIVLKHTAEESDRHRELLFLRRIRH